MLFEKIQEGQFEFPSQPWAQISSSAKDLISHMLVRDPSERYSADEILLHPWIVSPPSTCLMTPKVLNRNSSSQLLDTFADKAVAINRMMMSQLTISESRSSGSSSACCSSAHSTTSNPFFSSASVSSDSPNFFIGDFSDDEEDEDELGQSYIKTTERNPSLQLSLPSSKLAQRRKSRQI